MTDPGIQAMVSLLERFSAIAWLYVKEAVPGLANDPLAELRITSGDGPADPITARLVSPALGIDANATGTDLEEAVRNIVRALG